jgi:hypothetical protein
MAENESKSFFKTIGAKITFILATIGVVATLLANLTTIQNFFQNMFGTKKGVKIVDVSVNDSAENVEVLNTADTSKNQASVNPMKIDGVNFTKQEVDIKMRNSGEEVAFIKRVELVIKRKWVLTVDKGPSFMVRPSSKTYDITMDSERAAPYTIPVKVSHQIDPGGTDRFTLSLKHGPGTYNTYVYLADVKIYFNEDEHPIVRENIFFAFEASSSNSYKKNDSGNLQSVNEINSIHGEKEETINNLVNKILQQ